MNLSIKRFLFNFFFNSALLVMLIIGIQNSKERNKVDLIINETVELPLSFIIGVSFISGSLLGSFVNITRLFKEE